MVSILYDNMHEQRGRSPGSGFNMAEGPHGQKREFTVNVSSRNDQERESESERGSTPGGDTPRDGMDDRGEIRSNEENTDYENYTLSAEDEMRIKQKRERNRVAAARCRDRRRQRAATLVQESDDLEDENGDLAKEIAQLQKEKLKLQEILCKHLPNCGVQSGESNQQQQQIPHRLQGKHPHLEHHQQPRKYQRQHQHPLLLNETHQHQQHQQHRQQVLKQQHPQRPIQEHHPPQHKPDLHQVHRPQGPQQYPQHQLHHQQYDQPMTTANQLISQQPFCSATRSFSATE
ncbi:GATA zinc finger domain-containing protein 10-like [Asterias rubens]|uniref:GATA zinc finger domain-containing protein 10-like n=1 Tax=Asterias rubens TaxID=7604 RepID=UPI0014552915|nr:GATA zinc finger domain-containing protein 10-like [Asterias rubens]XP_033632555.1 GATA zinc finger domain-containing protein 10-like [Asterias rubens]